ncbi:hypothetical protein WICPIJ_005877 [Wickerhamomyces pijperi]|uniref:Uncharacterized protein n=1 Tax=Wickerhamomyces pijperi TaxID=599730 RepID=A0A9P8TLH6_WICPI|nr:hypothetical protein WICPIJ_005877 [Wickerhamomyces pijperi]
MNWYTRHSNGANLSLVLCNLLKVEASNKDKKPPKSLTLISSGNSLFLKNSKCNFKEEEQLMARRKYAFCNFWFFKDLEMVLSERIASILPFKNLVYASNFNPIRKTSDDSYDNSVFAMYEAMKV